MLKKLALALVVAWFAASSAFAQPATTEPSVLNTVGDLPLARLPAGSLDQVIGYFGAVTANAISINNCSGALTYSTTTHTFGCNTSSGTGTVTSVVCGTGLSGGTITTSGTCSLALNSATLQSSSALNPSGTSSTTAVMMGLGSTCHITPVFSSRIKVEFYGAGFSSVAAQTFSFGLRFGTGTAPANGAAATGTLIGTNITGASNSIDQSLPMSDGGIITGLTPGTAVWLDLTLTSSSTSATATLQGISCAAMEF
jgi:hypothetical protein